jgi:exodeoxyribonuclease VII small subunit
MQNKNIGFEASMERLEKIVAELSREGITLDESLALYEEGIALTRSCTELLEKAEQSVKMLQAQPDGAVSLVDFQKTED